MKSASFSQCQRLTVVSRRDGETSGAMWDLRDVGDWKMGVLSAEEINSLCVDYLDDAHGTVIFWDDCDRLSEEGSLTEEEFNRLIVHARNELSLIFHRYLAGDVKSRKLSILVNGLALEPYDPFYSENDATQRLECEEIRIGSHAAVKVQPWILPHYSKLALADYDRLSGAEGLLRNQGFYVYRQHRLIISGTWFRLVKHGELSQLVRIAIDIPNSLDAMWKITVDKSDAQLPALLRGRLLQIVAGIRGRAGRVIRSKGAKIGDGKRIPVWSRYARGGQIRYAINRDHPLIRAIITQEDISSEVIIAALGAIEQSVPVASLGQDVTSDPDRINQVSSDPREVLLQLEVAIVPMLAESGGNMQRMLQTLQLTEPFAQNWKLVCDHLTKKGWMN